MQPSNDNKHYFDSEPTVDSDRSEVPLYLPDLSLELATDSGVFARSGIDSGTKLLLLDGPSPTPGDSTLMDLGAGYGPIAITLAIRNPTAQIWAVEINSRARQLCVENAKRAGVQNIEVAAPDDVPADLTIDRLWSNPPIRIGKVALHDLLNRWMPMLKQSGSAHLVVQKHLGSDSLQQWLTKNGWPTARRCSRAGYRILDAQASTDSATLNTGQTQE